MGQRQKQHMGRSEGDDRELPGRDVAADDQVAMDSKAIRREGDEDETGRKPSTGKGGSLDAE
jgi:hypothetical protein